MKGMSHKKRFCFSLKCDKIERVDLQIITFCKNSIEKF